MEPAGKPGQQYKLPLIRVYLQLTLTHPTCLSVRFTAFRLNRNSSCRVHGVDDRESMSRPKLHAAPLRAAWLRMARNAIQFGSVYNPFHISGSVSASS